MSLAKIGKKFTEDHKRKIGLSQIGNKRALGNKLSVDTRRKMSLAKTGRKRVYLLNGKYKML